MGGHELSLDAVILPDEVVHVVPRASLGHRK